MTRIYLILLLALYFFLSCDEANDENDIGYSKTDCVNIEQNSNWATENFKEFYTIQFPEFYEGAGMVGFEGNTFYKNRDNNTIIFSYQYCGPLWCEDYGDTLSYPFPDSIIYPDPTDSPIWLTSSTIFCSDDDIVGILYYSADTISIGIHYMLQGEYYLEGLRISFQHTEYPEVENIIRTIKAVARIGSIEYFNDIPTNNYYNNEIFQGNQLDVYGTWKCFMVSGGWAGDVNTTDFHFDYLKTKPYGIWGFIEADTLLDFGRIVIDTVIADNIPLVRFVPDDSTRLILYDLEKYLYLFGHDTLVLEAPCCDRYNYHFLREE